MNKNFQKGSSIIEMMVAFAILALAITAVIQVSFGNQSTAVSSELNSHALYIAEGQLEDAYASSIANWESFDDFPAVLIDTLFTKELFVDEISLCAKRTKSTVTWGDVGNPQEITLTNVFTDIEASAELDHDCPAGESPPWLSAATADIANVGQSATDIDVFGNMIYLTSNKYPPANNPDFFIYEFDPSSEELSERSSLNMTDQRGLNAVDAGTEYAYVASASTTKQLQVIKISNPDAPNDIETAIGGQLIGVNPAGSYPAAVSIFYYDERVYVGTKETAGPEFHIFDVSNPLQPVHIGALELTHNVNAILVDGDYAYLATSDNNHELMVINISDPSNLDHPDDTGLGYNAAGNYDGTALTLLGNYVYLGRAQNNPAAAHDFFVLERNAVLDGDVGNDGLTDSEDLGLSNNAYVTGIIVRTSGEKRLAFLGTDNPTVGMEMWDVSTPTNIKLNSSCSEPNFAENNTGIDMNDAYVFTSNRSNGEIRVFKDAGECS